MKDIVVAESASGSCTRSTPTRHGLKARTDCPIMAARARYRGSSGEPYC